MHLQAERRTAGSDNPIMPLWRLQREGHAASCEIEVRSGGFEGRFLVDGRFLYSYTFTQPGDAVAWASEREERLRQQGWTPQR